MKKLHLNQMGMSLIEILIVMAISTVILTATISAFVKQERVMRDESTKTNLRALGRIAIENMTMEIRRTGYGFAPEEGITAMSVTSLSIQGNTDEVVTNIEDDVSAGDNDVDVFDDTNFADGDKIVFYDPSPGGLSEVDVIDGTPSSNKIDIVNTFTNSYLVEDGVVVSTYHSLVFAYDAGNNRITRQEDAGGVIPVVGKVSALTFTYMDETGAVTATMADVRRVGIQLTMTDVNGNSTVSVVFNTDINLRNMD